MDGLQLHKARQKGAGFPQGQGEGDIALDPLVQGQQGQGQQGEKGGKWHKGSSFWVFPDSVHAFGGKGKGGVWMFLFWDFP